MLQRSPLPTAAGMAAQPLTIGFSAFVAMHCPLDVCPFGTSNPGNQEGEPGGYHESIRWSVM